jgi:hypothetical protein
MNDDETPQQEHRPELDAEDKAADTRQVTATTLVVASAILLILGLTVISPAPGFLFESLGVICAAIATVMGRGARRLVAIMLLLLTATAATSLYDSFRHDMDLQTERANRDGG